MKATGRERLRAKCINGGVIWSALTFKISFSCLIAVGQTLLVVFSCTKCPAHLTKWIGLFIRPWGPLENWEKDKHAHSQGQDELLLPLGQGQISALYLLPTPNSKLRRREKVPFLSEPIPKALTSYSKRCFHWLHKLLGSLFKKIDDRFLNLNSWDSDLGHLGRGPGICIYCKTTERFEHKWLLDLLAKRFRDNSNPAYKFWLCHRLDAQL